MIISTFIGSLGVFVLIGVLSSLVKQNTTEDYLLAGHSVPPWLVALSAIATNNSGYMFIGMIGYTYKVGLASAWVMIGWILGDLVASLTVHKRLRTNTESTGALSFPSILSQWHGTHYGTLRVLSALFIIMFLGTYAAAQLNAGSKALHVLIGWRYQTGAMIGALIVMLYCFSGGIRASIWTDAAQSFVMIGAMFIICYVSIDKSGGAHVFYSKLFQVSPHYMDWFPRNLRFGYWMGPISFILGWFFAGLGVVGQPHIMIRFMALKDPEQMPRVRAIYYAWFILFFGLTILAGLAARVMLPETAHFDAELALPTLALKLLPDFWVGIILAGLFAATISTADSQILSCSAAISHDLNFKSEPSYVLTKAATVIITLLALTIALTAHKSVFTLVLIAWSALGSTFGPLLCVYAWGGKPSERVAISMMLVGFISMWIWHDFELSDTMYEIAPGMIAGFLVYYTHKFAQIILDR